MPLLPLHGHEAARTALARAVRSGTLPQSVLLHGPAGIGKERLALWVAQLLVCESPGEEAPCGRCISCRMTSDLQHPDVHWFFPLPRPDAASPEKLREKLEDARGNELQARRVDPFHRPSFDKPAAHFLASIQNLQQRASVRPAMGRRKVFILGDAEAMVPQEASPEAANAFLKLLEEPPVDTTLLLTAQQPGSLLATIVSRVLPVRLLPLTAAAVEEFLREVRGVDAEQARRVAAISGGAIGRALQLLPSQDGSGRLESIRQAGKTLLLAVLADSAAPRLAAAHAQAPAGARGEFLHVLDSFAALLRDLLTVAAGAAEEVVNVDQLDLLRRSSQQKKIHPLGAAAALERVDRARILATGNVNPQLILGDLLRGVHSDLQPA